MKRSIAELITRDPEKFAHHDRVFKNNPVVMQGMGLAPLVVLATTGKNALMLAVAVALLLTPSRMLACLVSRLFPLRDEQPAPEELEKKLLPRALVYSGSAAVVYLAAYPILNAVFGTDLLMLGIYLPMLVVEPLLTYRFGVCRKPCARLSPRVCASRWATRSSCSSWAACGSGWRWAVCLGSSSAALSCPWHPCRQAVSSCWAWCVPSGARWPANTRNT